MITTPDGVALYTEDDIREKNAQSYRLGAESRSERLRNEAIEYFKSEVRHGSMSKEDAENVFNGLAAAIGWKEVDSLSYLYRVTVSFMGDVIATFEDVEADDEDGAVEEVSSNLNVRSVEVTLDLEYNGQYEVGTAIQTYDFDTSDIEFEAEEQNN